MPTSRDDLSREPRPALKSMYAEKITFRVSTIFRGWVLFLLLAPLHAWNGDPTPVDDYHLLRVPPTHFVRTGNKLKLIKSKDAIFGQAVPLKDAVRTSFNVRFAGEYFLWTRVSQLKLSPTHVKVKLLEGEKQILSNTICDDAGGPGLGGPGGFSVYQDVALKTAPDGTTNDSGDGILLTTDKDDDVEAATNEILIDLGEKKSWAHMLRVESPKGDRPFYWWKVGQVKLEAGSYQMRVAPLKKPHEEAMPYLGASFLTTSDEIQYPFAGDISPPRSSFIRFRIDELPEEGTTLGIGMRVHYDPWSTGRGHLNPSGFHVKNSEPHQMTGFTRWYRLQDLERAPGMGGGESHLFIAVGAGLDKCRGATQFAVFPHKDFVLREISWNEPEGTNISLATDFENHLHMLRTFRDHARENYEKALQATKERLFPLTRGPLYFGNAWGYANGTPYEYMVKTLRLLGFNSASAPHDGPRSARNYGWTLHTGQYWPPGFMPYDEAKSAKKYEDHYKNRFKKQEETYKHVKVFQIADEPGEINKSEMSAPQWRYVEDDGGYWRDYSGGSDFNSRTDLHDCVLEGVVSKHHFNFTIRAATDDAKLPTKWVSWSMGRVGPTLTVNLAVQKVGYGRGGRGMLSKPGASIGNKTPFKIIFEGGKAALYINNRLIHQHDGLPEKGGFGIVGQKKSIHALKFREIRKDEHIDATSLNDLSANLAAKTDEDLELDELDLGEDKPDWLEPLPLKEFIKEHWVEAGGIPEAQEGFRKWAATKGLSPKLFGKGKWEEVRLLTIPSLAKTKEERRLFYWSRRYSGWLTPRMFKLAADGILKGVPNKDMVGFVALSGHSLYFPSAQPLDMFHLASEGYPLMPGVSDWMSMGGWRWDSHQAVAFSVAPYNAGARRYGGKPVSFPMMHCVWPSHFRSSTMLANNVKYISYYNYGPIYMVTEGHWSNGYGGYATTGQINNRAAQVDDVLSPGYARPSRVAMLYARSTEYWHASSSFADKRAAFLGMSHEYFKPELVTEEQVEQGALEHYDALYILDRWVKESAQKKILDWTKKGGLLWACTNAATKNEYNEDLDLLVALNVERSFEEVEGLKKKGYIRMLPVEGKVKFSPHGGNSAGIPSSIKYPKSAVVRARYADERPAWLEMPAGKGRLVYLGHRCGQAYTWRAFRIGGAPVIWADRAREPLVTPLHEARVERELILSKPCIVASPISTESGTVIVLYNMRGRSPENLLISLKEPARPHSVHAFDGFDLAPLEYTFKDGRVEMALDQLHGAQMILVRRCPPPADPRLEEMQTRSTEMMASDEWQDVSAGAWFAGFHNEWQLSGTLIRLLKHKRWEVRRSASEALGRLAMRGRSSDTPGSGLGKAQLQEAGDALVASIDNETDTHALGDALWALGRTGHMKAKKICAEHVNHKNWFVRSQALRGLIALAETGDVKKATKPVDRALADPDLRVRQRGIELLGRLDAGRTFDLALKCWKGERDAKEQHAWNTAFFRNEETVQRYLSSGMPGPENLFLNVAIRNATPEFHAGLKKRIEQRKFSNAHLFTYAVIKQDSPELARMLFNARDDLPNGIKRMLPKILEHAFEAGLGNSLQDWGEWLAQKN